jgi:predicted ATPase
MSTAGDPAFSPGDRFGRYVLVRPLGRGSAAVVWEAVLEGASGFRRSVALKLLRTTGSHGQGGGMLAEARLGALLHHPNVVATHDLGRVDGRWFVALELVRGASLSDVWRTWGPLDQADLLEVGVQVCAGLDHIHSLVRDGAPVGLIHRDVKPQNLLLDPSGLVKIADLGIARMVSSPASPAGTPGFQPPEQGTDREDARTDLYALGVTLFGLATGTFPFEGAAGPTRLDAAATARLTDALVDVVPALTQPILRCLAGDPELRWPSARALGEALLDLRGEVGPAALALLVPGGPQPVDAAAPIPVRSALLVSPDRLFGRDTLLAEVLAQIDAGERLLCLVGPGGSGKSRLAAEVAARLVPSFDAVRADLTGARTPGDVCAAAAAALELGPTVEDPERVGRALAGRGPVALILDDAELAVEVLPQTVGAWLRAAPAAVILVTSRLVLRLPGARRVTVEALDPAAAAALFLDRAGGDLDPGEVRSLVAALDHLPLAIEIAAARADSHDLLARVSDHLRAVLDAPTDSTRHRSLRASVAASFELLSEPAAAAMAQLTVFEGGFTLEAAEAVVDVDVLPLDVLVELADAHLVRVDPVSERVDMPSAVRRLASERLTAEARLQAEQRHGAAMARLGAPEVLAAFETSQTWRERVLAEQANLTAACRRALRRGDRPVAVRVGLAAAAALRTRGPLQAGVSLLRQVVDSRPDRLGPVSPGSGGPVGRDELSLQIELGDLQRIAGDPEAAGTLADAVSAARGFGLRRHEVRARSRLVQALDGRAPPGRTLRAAQEAVRLASALGDPVLHGEALMALGTHHFRACRLDDAQREAELGQAAFRRAGHLHGSAMATHLVGIVAGERAERSVAQEALEQALDAYRAIGDRRLEAVVLGNLALLESMAGRRADAIARRHQAIALHRQMGSSGAAAHELVHQAGDLAQAGDRAGSQQALHQAISLFQEQDNLGGEAVALLQLGVDQAMAARLGEARATLEQALAAHRRLGNRRPEAVACQLLALVCRMRGEVDACEAWLARAEPIFDEIDNPSDRACLLHDRSALHLLRGDTDRALEAAEQARAGHLAAGDPRWIGLSSSALAGALRQASDLAGARAVVEGALADPSVAADAAGGGLLRAELGAILEGEGDLAGAARVASEAVGLLLEVNVCVAARVLADLAGLQHRLGDPSAEQLLAEAEEIAAQAGVGEGSDLARAIAQAQGVAGRATLRRWTSEA